ncbi:MAG: helix-turn-helix domain-containing protein [Rhodospirillales bacterium]
MAGMHPEDIKAAIRKTGITLTELSLSSGLSESAVRQAILFRHCPAGERAVIDHLGLPPHEIWPNRYDRDGNRIIGRNQLNTTKSKPVGHRQKGAVA